MPDPSSDSPLDKLIASTQKNIAGDLLARTSQETLANYPSIGSLETHAQKMGQVICEGCHALNLASANFCRNCGRQLNKSSFCPSCQSPTCKSDKFCSQCGHSLNPTS